MSSMSRKRITSTPEHIAKLTSDNYWDRSEAARREADEATRDARKDAEFAADQYRVAIERRRWLAWLLRHPDYMDGEVFGTPADHEQYIRMIVRLADTFLRSSFRGTAKSRHYRQLARKYEQEAQEHQPYLARYYERGRAWLARTGQSDAEIRAAHGLDNL